MRAEHLVEYRAVILTPEVSDQPEDFEDLVHDVLATTKGPDGKPRTTLVVLDFTDLEDSEFPTWMKAAGPGIPDANMRVVVTPARLRVAQALGLTFYEEWYDSLESALKAGG